MSDRPFHDDLFMPPPELKEAWERHKEIVKLGHPVLRQVAKPATRILVPETQRLIERMKVVMKEANGLGLAAPQVGVSTRILVYDVHDEMQVLINPVIQNRKGEQLDPPEGCLSIPGLQGQVKRALEIKVKALNQRGRPITLRVTELEARVIQHEIDHLDGILFIDRADPETLGWATGSDEAEEGDPATRE
ncbi:MAG TPA: peptide deformylase [Chthonomonadaceae bacterium]|nr:peptide deformylase [Chthonomonadaceae bacterium]